MNPATLSIVIPSFNGRRLLETCLASIRRHRTIELDVIVVDDGSTDGSVEWIEAAHPWVRVVRRAENGGFVAAANAGIAAAQGEFIQLLNNDAEVTAGWIEAGLLPFADPRVGSVAPLVLFRSDPTKVDSAGDCYALMGWPYKRGHGESVSNWSNRSSEEVFGASGSSAFYRGSVLRRVGGFDPSFGSYYEDVDLAFRLRWAGFSCVYTPRCRILHEVSASYDHGRPELQRRMARNAELLFWGNLPLRWLSIAVLPHLCWGLMQAGFRLRKRRLGAFAGGKLDAIPELAALGRRRRVRRDLARSAPNPPRFPISVNPFGGLRGHIQRRETGNAAR